MNDQTKQALGSTEGSQDGPCPRGAEQAAGKPEGNEGLDQGRAWIRDEPPGKQKPKGPSKGGSARGRTVYARELEGGGCLLVTDTGEHRVVVKFSPPEGEGWRALHDETLAKPGEKAQNRKAAKRTRKELAGEGELKAARARALMRRQAANRGRGTKGSG